MRETNLQSSAHESNELSLFRLEWFYFDFSTQSCFISSTAGVASAASCNTKLGHPI